jgi:hypothetical protein
MTRFLSFLLWTAVFLLIVLAVDQLLVRVPASHPAHVAAATFYRDLRARALDLAKERGGLSTEPPAASPPATRKREEKPVPPPARPATVEGVIERRQAASAKVVVQKTAPKTAAAPATKAPVSPPPRGAVQEESPRYVYADASGELHFAETLAEVPEEYREKAKRMGE